MIRISLIPFLLLAMGGIVSCRKGPADKAEGAEHSMRFDEQVGATYTREVKTEMRHARLTLGNRQGFADFTEDGVVEIQNLKVENGRTTKDRKTLKRGRAQLRIQIDGMIENHDDIDPLEGETVECENVGKEWTMTLQGKKPQAHQIFSLRPFPFNDKVKWFPADVIRVGCRWEVDAKSVVGFPFTFEKITKGTWNRHFKKVTPMNGESCAEIVDQVDIVGSGAVPLGERNLELKGTITTWRSLKDGMTLKEIITGELKLEVLLPGGQPMTVAGPCHIQLTQTRK